MARILVAEDDPKQADLLRAYLETDGHHVTTARDGAHALAQVKERRPDLLLLDLMMPNVDGWQVLTELGRDSEIPVIVLTARIAEPDQLRGFRLGADDYITKPYSPRQVVARVRAVLRRTGRLEPDPILTVGPIRIDRERYEVRLNDTPLDLTSREMTLLETLAEHPGRAFTRTYLLQEIAGFDSDALERTIDMHVLNLRRKIEPDPAHPRYLLTVKGRGYKVATPDDMSDEASPTRSVQE